MTTSVERTRKRRRADRPVGKVVHSEPFSRHSAQLATDAQRLLAQIPADTRNLTQRLSGDPVFERSALFLKQQEAGK